MESPQPAEGHVHAKPGEHVSGHMPVCPQCAMSPAKPGSAKVAWAVAGVAAILLLVVVFLKLGPSGNFAVGLSGLALLSIVACPLMMGGMMWMMMRKGHG